MKFDKPTLILRILVIWFWVMSSIGFALQFVLPKGATFLGQAVSMLADLTILLLALWTIKHRADYIIIGSFLIISYISTVLTNDNSITIWLNGNRNFFGLLFVMPVLRYFWDNERRHDMLVNALDKQIMIFLLANAFCLIVQFLTYGAGDQGGGIFGNHNSGIASITIYCTSFYLMHKKIDTNRFFVSLTKNWQLIALLLPTFLNETKISLVLLPLYFLLLLPFDKKLVARLSIALPIVFIVIAGSATIYLSANVSNEGTDILNGDSFISEYLIGELDEVQGNAEYGLNYESDLPDVPRIAKIALMPMIFRDEPGHDMFGFGTGIFKGGTSIKLTRFQRDYEWILVGTQPVIFSTYMQLGIVGSVWYVLLFVSFFVRKPKLYSHRDVNIQLYLLAIFTALLIYSDLMPILPFPFISLLFLMLSWTNVKQLHEADTEDTNSDSESKTVLTSN